MVNENNNINKYVPENVKRPTFTVSYYQEEGTQISPLIQDGAYRSWKANVGEHAYGPVDKWCSSCSKYVDVSSSARYCSGCGGAFGTVAKKDDVNTQIDKNRREVADKGGTFEYYEETGKKPDGTEYNRKGTSYTGPK